MFLVSRIINILWHLPWREAIDSWQATWLLSDVPSIFNSTRSEHQPTFLHTNKREKAKGNSVISIISMYCICNSLCSFQSTFMLVLLILHSKPSEEKRISTKIPNLQIRKMKTRS